MAESDIDALPQAKENQVRQAVAAVAASACFLSGVRHRLSRFGSRRATSLRASRIARTWTCNQLKRLPTRTCIYSLLRSKRILWAVIL
jgi:hypothetical protein